MKRLAILALLACPASAAAQNGYGCNGGGYTGYAAPGRFAFQRPRLEFRLQVGGRTFVQERPIFFAERFPTGFAPQAYGNGYGAVPFVQAPVSYGVPAYGNGYAYGAPAGFSNGNGYARPYAN